MVLQDNFKLNNGVAIPKLGLGTWFIADDQAGQAVREALKLGYRHVDSAQAYGNERGVGEGIRTSGMARANLFVTTKLAAEIKSYPEAVQSIDRSLRTMGLDYLDLMLIHSPKPWMAFHDAERYLDGNREAWRALEEALAAGKLRSIGVSNFQEPDLENLLKGGTVKPMVNQLLAHISNTPFGLINFCQKHDILVQAYSPVAHGELLKNERVAAMAKKYGVTVPQLSIRYCLELGLLPLPKTANPAHMKNNADVDFSISTADLTILKNLEQIRDYGAASRFPVFGGRP